MRVATRARGEAPEQIRTLLKRAATFRAAGMTWADVAARVGRAESTCRQWPCVHRAAWAEAFGAAYQQVVEEAEAEAWATQRQLLTGKDAEGRPVPAAVVQSAAHSIMANAAKLRPRRHEHAGAEGGPLQLVWLDGLTEAAPAGVSNQSKVKKGPSEARAVP